MLAKASKVGHHLLLAFGEVVQRERASIGRVHGEIREGRGSSKRHVVSRLASSSLGRPVKTSVTAALGSGSFKFVNTLASAYPESLRRRNIIIGIQQNMHLAPEIKATGVNEANPMRLLFYFLYCAVKIGGGNKYMSLRRVFCFAFPLAVALCSRFLVALFLFVFVIFSRPITSFLVFAVVFVILPSL